MPSPAGPTRPDRSAAIAALLLLVSILAWAYVVHYAYSGDMPMDMPGMDMPGMDMSGMAMGPSTTLWALFAMWAAMMVGMMLPATLPTILLYARMAAGRPPERAPLSVPAFVSGYLVVWIGFSLLAALVQTRLSIALLDAAPGNRWAAIGAGVTLLLAGLYQWSPLKTRCLSHCRTPLGHLTSHWREGAAGAFRMGASHGVYCLACCWLLMLLLFVGGVMNPWWVGGLTLLVLLERLVPRGDLLGRGAGVALAVWGVVILVRLA